MLFVSFFLNPTPMKTTLLALLLTASAYAQSVGDVELKNLDVTYVELKTEEQNFSTKFRLLVDYGQATKKDSEKFVRDANGEPIIFNSIAHALNFMADYGYKLDEIYEVRIREDWRQKRYVLRRGSDS